MTVKDIRFSPNKDNGRYVAKYILEAKTSLDVLAYSLTSEEISGALLLAKKRNIKVRVICDKQQAQIANAKCADIGGRIDKKSGLMHNKVIVRDNTCVLTGSFNFTSNAINNNRENFIVLCDDKVAQTYTDEFNKLWANNT